jgi:Cu/Ag efflux protein CusF
MKHRLLAAAALLTLAAHAATPEWIRATVVKVDPERSRVTLDHERIGSIGMEPMVMPFKVEKKVDLQGVKPGDKVRFTISNKDNHLVVESLEKAR